MDKALALIVMLVAAFGTLNWYYGATKATAVSNVLHEAKQLAPAPKPIRYELRFEKSPGYEGPNRLVQDLCMPAVIQKTDVYTRIEASFTDFGRPYIMSLVWDKTVNSEYGEWHQTGPKFSGQWRLNDRNVGFMRNDGDDGWPISLTLTSTYGEPCAYQ